MMPTTGMLPSRVVVHPRRLAGRVHVPGDKSLSHRALIVGALADGGLTVRGVAPSDDVAATAAALRTLGAEVALSRDGGGLSGMVRGPLGEPQDVLDCNNSGTALRLLAGVVAGIDGMSVLTGDASLRRRPVDRVLRPLRAMGADIDARENGRLPPLVIRGARLRGLDHTSPVASAQVKSAVLLAGLVAQGPTRITSPARSRDHTERLLRHLGVEIRNETGDDGEETVRLEPSTVRGGTSVDVLRDPSSAAFWLVAAAPLIGEPVVVAAPGICVNPTRTGAIETLRALGAEVEVHDVEEVCGEPRGTVTVGSARLGEATLAGEATVAAIDEIPVLAIAGALSERGLEVRDAAELRVKESDRIASLARLFAALGARLDERPDGFFVPGGQRFAGGTVDAAGDHRIAMAAAIAATLADGPVEILGFDVVSTSYPTFLDDLVALGGRVDT